MKHWPNLLLMALLCLAPNLAFPINDSLGVAFNTDSSDMGVAIEMHLDTQKVVANPKIYNNVGLPVIVNADTLFILYGDLGPYSVKERAARASQRIEKLIGEIDWRSDSLRVITADNYALISYKNRKIIDITQADAAQQGLNIAECSEIYRDRTVQFVKASRTTPTHAKNLAVKLGLLLLSLVALVVCFRLLQWGYRKILFKLESTDLKPFRIANVEVLNSERQREATILVLRGFRIFLILLILYLALPLIFSIFPMTRGIANTLFSYILKPLKSTLLAILAFIPNLITIAIVLLVTRFAMRFLRFLAVEVERGEVKLPGFYSDWARPTFNILRFIVYAFVVAILFPYIPGSDSNFVQGVALLVGVIIVIGSSKAISNIMAGLLLTYIRPFKKGRYVKIGDVSGKVLGRTLMNTRIKTFDEEDVTIPNTHILQKTTTSYSSVHKHIGGYVLKVNLVCSASFDAERLSFIFNSIIDEVDSISAHPSPSIYCTGADENTHEFCAQFYTKDFDQTKTIRSEFVVNFSRALRDEGVKFSLK